MDKIERKTIEVTTDDILDIESNTHNEFKFEDCSFSNYIATLVFSDSLNEFYKILVNEDGTSMGIANQVFPKKVEITVYD